MFICRGNISLRHASEMLKAMAQGETFKEANDGLNDDLKKDDSSGAKLYYGPASGYSLTLQSSASTDVMPIGQIMGRVYDRCTNQPIVGAVIDIGIAKAVSDVNGQYIMYHVPATSYDKNTRTWKGNYEAVVDMTKASIAGVKVTGYKDKYNFNINVTFSPAAVSNGAVDRSGNGNFDFVIAKIGQENVCDTIKPTIAQTPMSAAQGATVSQWGSGFTPNSTATLHFQKPDGTEFTPASQTIKPDGSFSISYTIPSDRTPGTYKWWGIDSSGQQSNTVSYTVTKAINPTIAQTPMSGPAGTNFSQWGSGFTPNSTATLHFQKPDGTEYPTEKQSIKSDGTFSITYASPTNKPAGTYKWWAVDSSGKVSNTVSYTITINPTIAQTPMSGRAGTSFAQWGTGFTPNSTATLHFKKPDGTEYPTEKQSIKSDGTFSITYASPTNKPAGTYKWWAVDSAGKVSNTVSYTITK